VIFSLLSFSCYSPTFDTLLARPLGWGRGFGDGDGGPLHQPSNKQTNTHTQHTHTHQTKTMMTRPKKKKKKKKLHIFSSFPLLFVFGSSVLFFSQVHPFCFFPVCLMRIESNFFYSCYSIDFVPFSPTVFYIYFFFPSFFRHLSLFLLLLLFVVLFLLLILLLCIPLTHISHSHLSVAPPCSFVTNAQQSIERSVVVQPCKVIIILCL